MSTGFATLDGTGTQEQWQTIKFQGNFKNKDKFERLDFELRPWDLDILLQHFSKDNDSISAFLHSPFYNTSIATGKKFDEKMKVPVLIPNKVYDIIANVTRMDAEIKGKDIVGCRMRYVQIERASKITKGIKVQIHNPNPLTDDTVQQKANASKKRKFSAPTANIFRKASSTIKDEEEDDINDEARETLFAKYNRLRGYDPNQDDEDMIATDTEQNATADDTFTQDAKSNEPTAAA